MKFSKDGKFIKTWGKKGSAPGEIDIPHALAMDSRGPIFLGDRQNNRIQIFDQETATFRVRQAHLAATNHSFLA